MLDSAVRNNGLESYFAEIISVDSVRTYKPSPRVHALGPEILNLPAAEILFVSSTYGMPPEPRRLATRFAGATDPEQKWKTGGLLPILGCSGLTGSRRTSDASPVIAKSGPFIRF
jgi:hypothetical protein